MGAQPALNERYNERWVTVYNTDIKTQLRQHYPNYSLIVALEREGIKHNWLRCFYPQSYSSSFGTKWTPRLAGVSTNIL